MGKTTEFDLLAALRGTSPGTPHDPWRWALVVIGVAVAIGGGITLWSAREARELPVVPGVGTGDPNRQSRIVEQAAFIREDPIVLRHHLAGRSLMQACALAAVEIRTRENRWANSPRELLESPALAWWALDDQGEPWRITKDPMPAEFTPFTVFANRSVIEGSGPWPTAKGTVLFTHQYQYGSEPPILTSFHSQPPGFAINMDGYGATPRPIEYVLVPLGDAASMYAQIHGAPPPDLATLLAGSGLTPIRERVEPMLTDLSAIECWQYAEKNGWFCLVVTYRGKPYYVNSSKVQQGRPEMQTSTPPEVLWRQSFEDAVPAWISVGDFLPTDSETEE